MYSSRSEFFDVLAFEEAWEKEVNREKCAEQEDAGSPDSEWKELVISNFNHFSIKSNSTRKTFLFGSKLFIVRTKLIELKFLKDTNCPPLEQDWIIIQGASTFNRSFLSAKSKPVGMPVFMITSEENRWGASFTTESPVKPPLQAKDSCCCYM